MVIMTPPALAGMGHKALRHGVTSIRAYVCACICHVNNRGITNVTVDFKLTCKLTCKFYIHIYVRVSLRAHNFGYHHAIPFKFDMILT